MYSMVDDIKRKIDLRKTARENMGEPIKSEPIIQCEEDNQQLMLQNINDLKNLYFVNDRNKISSHRKVLGPGIVFMKKVVRKFLRIFMRWYIDPVLERQTRFNKKALESIEILNQLVIKLEERKYRVLENSIEDINLKLKSIEDIIKNQERVVDLKIESLKEKVENSTEQIEDLKEKVKIHNEKLYLEIENLGKIMDNKNRIIANDTDTIKELMKDDALKIQYILKKLNIYCDIALLDQRIEYFDFENEFRGSREELIKRQSRYVEYFRISGGSRIIDIGCGRGEFLELMSNENISAYGIDIYKPFVDYCQRRGFEARQEDALTHLSNLPDHSIGGIFMDSVIEHLENDYIMALIEVAYRKLKTGCHFIIITPNPETFAGMKNFYLDIEHKKPIHYLTIEYLLKKANFMHVSRYENEETAFPYDAISIEGDKLSNKEAFNTGIKNINNLLFGNREYTVIARK